MQPSHVKVMRKGTRSCRECRRRKIKCTRDSEHAAICRECSEYDRHCSSQGIVKKASTGEKSNLKIRISKLESIIERLSKAHPEVALEVISETESSSSRALSNATSSQNCNDPSQEQEQCRSLKSPLFDLFDNGVVRPIPYAIQT